MFRALKIILGAALAVVVLAIIVLVGANLWLQSCGVQNRLKTAASEALGGATVSVNGASYTPWSGVQLYGLTVESPELARQGTMTARSLDIRFNPLGLADNKLEITHVALVDPVIHFMLPDPHVVAHPRIAVTEPSEIPAPSAPEPLEIVPPSGQAEAEAPRTSSPPELESAAPARAPIVVELKSYSVRNASFEVRQADGRLLVEGKGLTIRGNLEAGGISRGKAELAQLRDGRFLSLTKIKGDYFYGQQGTAVTDISGQLAGGKIHGEFFLQQANPALPFGANLRLQNVRLKELMAEAGIEHGSTNGFLNGKTQLSGSLRSEGSIVGGGELELGGSQIETLDFLRSFGALLGIQELQLIKLREAFAAFSVSHRKINIREINLKSDNLVLKAKGPVTFDGDLDLRARLLVNQNIQRRLRGFIDENFQPSTEQPGWKEMTFSIYGTVQRPATDFFKKFMPGGQTATRQALSVLESLVSPKPAAASGN